MLEFIKNLLIIGSYPGMFADTGHIPTFNNPWILAGNLAVLIALIIFAGKIVYNNICDEYHFRGGSVLDDFIDAITLLSSSLVSMFLIGIVMMIVWALLPVIACIAAVLLIILASVKLKFMVAWYRRNLSKSAKEQKKKDRLYQEMRELEDRRIKTPPTNAELYQEKLKQTLNVNI